MHASVGAREVGLKILIKSHDFTSHFVITFVQDSRKSSGVCRYRPIAMESPQFNTGWWRKLAGPYRTQGLQTLFAIPANVVTGVDNSNPCQLASPDHFHLHPPVVSPRVVYYEAAR